MKRRDWEEQAANWIAWIRNANGDAYADYAPIFFDEVLPSSGRRTLDIGCGEGRDARDLLARGHSVIACDGSLTMVRSASAQGGDGVGRYAVADAAALPFRDSAFDLAVAYNVLMDLDDLAGSLVEIARVLEPGGRFAACVLHPLSEAGRFDAREAASPFVITGSYFEEGPYRATFTRDGQEITFSSSRYPLQRYVEFLGAAGMRLEVLREPKAPAEAIAREPAEARWARIPNFLFMRAVKLATTRP